MKNFKIIVICTGNSCRSQMAEGYLKYFSNKMQLNIEVYIAGIEAHGINPNARDIMLEDGINISAHTSNLIEEFIGENITHVLTVCDHANQNCPIFPEKTSITHFNFSDPSKLKGSEKEIENAFRKTRNEIKIYCEKYLIKNFSQ